MSVFVVRDLCTHAVRQMNSCKENILVLTFLIWFSNTRDMANACSVFSFAMIVRLLISYLELRVKSSRAFL